MTNLNNKKSKLSSIIGKLLIILLFLFVVNNNSNCQTNSNEVINLTILNTESDEFAPSYNKFQNYLYFNRIKNGFSYFFSSEVVDSFKFKPPLFRADDINKEFNNQSYMIFLDEDQAVYSTYSLKSNRSYLNLFSAYYKKGKWTNPIILDSLSGDCFVSHPTVSPDGNIIIFSTDRSPEDIDTDLWMAVKQDNGTWGELAPLSTLNSPGNEITPFLKSSDSLFFSSNGLGGPGGYDLYLSVKKDGVWTRPYPINEINTKFDESDPCVLPNNSIIFASDRPEGKGGLDLYFFTPTTTNNESNTEKSPLEISAATTTYSIKCTKKVKFDYLYPVPFLSYSNTKGFVSFYDIVKKENRETNYYTSLISTLKSADTINLNFDTDNPELLKLKDSLIAFYYKQINIKKLAFISIDNKAYKDCIYLNSTIKDSIIETEYSAAVIDPNIIQISLNTRPEELFSYGQYFYDDSEIKIPIGKIINPNSILTINLDTLLNTSKSEFKILLQVTDKNRKIQNAALEFNVIDKKDKSPNKYKINEIEYNKITLIPYPDIFYFNINTICNIVKSSDKNIIIEYNPNQQSICEVIKTKLLELKANITIDLKSNPSVNTINIYF